MAEPQVYSIEEHHSIKTSSNIMAQFRAKKLDLGCFVNIMNIRDHTKRKVFEQHEPERYVVKLESRPKPSTMPQRIFFAIS